jgi:hypothetical protein
MPRPEEWWGKLETAFFGQREFGKEYIDAHEKDRIDLSYS